MRKAAGRALLGALVAGQGPLSAARRVLGDGRTLADEVAGRTVMITGASSGIGRATALHVAGAGAKVLLVSRSADALDELRAQIHDEGGVAFAHPADLSDTAAIDTMVDEVLADHGHVDALVNCAGHSIRRPVHKSCDRLHDFERMMKLNYFGAVHLTLRVLPLMRERGSGHVVNVGTMGTQTFPPQFAAYVASKAALDAFTRVAAAESAGSGVRFTTVHMPLVRTPMIEPTEAYRDAPALSPEQAAQMVARALRDKPRAVGSAVGTGAELSHALVPGITAAVKRAAVGPR